MANSQQRRKLRRAMGSQMPVQIPAPSSSGQNSVPVRTPQRGEKPSLSDAAKLIRGILASGATALFLASIYEYLSLAGVVDSMNAARAVLILAGLIGFFGVVGSELVWGKSHRQQLAVVASAAVLLCLSLWQLDSGTVRYRSAHAPAASAPAPPLKGLTHEQFCVVIAPLEDKWIAAHPDAPLEVRQNKKWTGDEFDWLNLRLGEEGLSPMKLYHNQAPQAPPLMIAKNHSSIDIGHAIFNGDIGTLAEADSNSKISATGEVTVNRRQTQPFITPPCL
jgi:hypothetical protein